MISYKSGASCSLEYKVYLDAGCLKQAEVKLLGLDSAPLWLVNRGW